MYTKAIALNESSPALYLNRSKCYKQLARFADSYRDALTAIELDDNYLKAYLACGEALVEMGKSEQSTEKIAKGLVKLRKAKSLCFKTG